MDILLEQVERAENVLNEPKEVMLRICLDRQLKLMLMLHLYKKKKLYFKDMGIKMTIKVYSSLTLTYPLSFELMVCPALVTTDTQIEDQMRGSSDT